METKRVGIALFGFGRIGRLHFGNILQVPGIDLRYVVDICEDEIRKACNIWNLTNTRILHPNDAKIALQDEKYLNYSDFHKIRFKWLPYYSVQAVLICTPTNTHVSLIEASVAANKHVFCEKPVAATSAETRKCYELAKSKHVHLFCAMQRYCMPCMISSGVGSG